MLKTSELTYQENLTYSFSVFFLTQFPLLLLVTIYYSFWEVTQTLQEVLCDRNLKVVETFS